MLYQICITADGKFGALDVKNGVIVCTAATLEDLKKKIDQISIKDTKRGDHNATYRRTSRSPDCGS